ncbi:MAG: hypothetical protein ACYC7A_20800 [Thermoanaerobaculia bacterium]
MQITLTNDQPETVTGRTHLVGSIETIASFSLAPGSSQSVRAIPDGTSLPAIVAVESSNGVRTSARSLALAHANRPVAYALRRSASQPAVGQLVVAKLSGKGSIRVYEDTSSQTPLVNLPYDSQGLESQLRISTASLLPNRPSFDGLVEIAPATGQAAFWVVNPPPGKRRSAGPRQPPMPRLSASGGNGCAGASGFTLQASAANGLSFGWTALNASFPSVSAGSSTNLTLGSAGYATILSTVPYPDRGIGRSELNIKVEAPISIHGLAASDALEGDEVRITWTKVQGSGLLYGTDFPATGTRVDLSTGNHTYRADAAGSKQISLKPEAVCGSQDATAAYVVSQPATEIDSFTADSHTVAPFATTTLRFTIRNAASWRLLSSLGNSRTPSSGTGSGSFTAEYGRNVAPGADTLTLEVTGLDGSVITQSLVISQPPPSIASFTADSTTVAGLSTTTLRFTISNATSWRLLSSLGNGRTPSSGTGSGSFTSTYSRNVASGADTITLEVTGLDESVITQSLVISQGQNPPWIASFTSSRNAVPPGGGATLSFAYSDGTSWSISSSKGNTISPSGGDSTTGGTAAYDRDTAFGEDVLTLTVTGPGGTSQSNLAINDCSTPSANITAPSSFPSGSTFYASMPAGAASYDWTVTGGSIQSGQGTQSITVLVTASAGGSVILAGTASNDCGSDHDTHSVSVTGAVPVISSFSANPTTIGFGGASTLTFTLENVTSWSLKSSIGNGFSQSSGTGSGTFTVTYSAANNTGVDAVAVLVEGPGGSAVRTIQITVN